ncbi:MAG: polysaccharide biosynthesis tyrosine autokinase [Phycisphaerales bacterium]|nr:MAG: polysaccharide biosynthesis tyrosine autokinase [Phycisphaerales bacterium]
MNNLEKYLDQVIDRSPAPLDVPLEEVPQEEAKPGFLQSVAKRWPIVFLVTLVGSCLGLPLVWLLVEPEYTVQGAVRVAPSVESILTGESSGGGGRDSYGNFLNTQAKILTSGPILQRIADDLKDRNLTIFSGKPQTLLGQLKAKLRPAPTGPVDPAVVLKSAVSGQRITAGHIARTELMAVTMKSINASEAKQVVDAFLQHYRAMYGTDSLEKENENLRVLEAQRDELRAKMERRRAQIRGMAEEYGTVALEGREDMELRRQSMLLTELTRLEAQRIALEANVDLLEETETASLTPDQLVAARKEYVNSDPMIAELSASIVQMEHDLLVAKQSLNPGNPVLIQRQQLRETFKQTLDQKRQELEKEFDDGLEERLKVAAEQRLANAEAQIQGVAKHEERLREVFNEQDVQTRQVGQTNLGIQDVQLDLIQDQELYDIISRRIKVMEMERQQRPRITPAYRADVISTDDRRVKVAAAVVFGAMACGLGLAFLRDKMDKTLQTPEDVARHLGLPILGTTTSSRTIKPAQFAEQIAGDYQTIRTNLRLLANGGMPRKLAVCSPGTREGKTTFAVNLATSLAKSGKKVLLIDGDLRKPDVRYMLKLSNGTPGVQDVLSGEDPSSAIISVPESGLHVLPANVRHLADVYELLVSSMAHDQIERMGREYDHVIIDTPPALAFPDALVWAKLTDAVVLVGFAGQTTAPELKEAKERFARIRARVLGAILSNVPAEQGLYRYGYGYGARATGPAGRAAKRKRLLLPAQGPEEDSHV